MAKVLLSCNCEVNYSSPSPNILDEVWCAKHNDKATVVRTPYTESNYGYKCECGKGRHFGTQKERMEELAVRHHNEHPTQTVFLTNGNEVYLEYRPDSQLL